MPATLTTTPADLAEEFDRFIATVTVCTHPDLPASTPEAAAALRQLRSWARSGRHGDPPQVTSCSGLGSAIVALPGPLVPPDLRDDLLGFDEKLHAAVQGYRASLRPPPRPPATLLGSKVVVIPDMIANLVAEAKRLQRRLVGRTQPSITGRYPARWYHKATRGSLYADLLGRAWREGRITGEKRGSRNQYDLDSVCAAYPQYSRTLLARSAKDAPARTGTNP